MTEKWAYLLSVFSLFGLTACQYPSSTFSPGNQSGLSVRMEVRNLATTFDIPLPTAMQSQCTNCHSNLIPANASFTHYPAAANLCGTCHDASANHVAGSDKKGVTTKKADDSCYQCHLKKDDKPHVHPALQMGDPSCTNCHDPHSANHRYFVREASIGELCMNCHEPHEGKSIHGAEKVEKNCLNCHNPHSSSETKLLNMPSGDLCLSCHDKEIPTQFATPARNIPNIKKKMKDVPFQHVGALDGCMTCHKPHSSPNERLLVEHYSTSNYNTYSGDPSQENPYALCFICHDSAILEGTNFTTAFRDEKMVNGVVQKKNLHWFHVRDAAGNSNKKLGRSCRICHDPHGSDQDFHINDFWSMNGQPIAIEFKRNDNGGTCAKTCHSARTYQRL